MGIPKFFRWISERYPCLSDEVSSKKIDYDNLYLDMNEIIHICSHPNDDSEFLLQLTEEVIFKNIFQYIEFVFQLIRPKKIFFMAVDGVAPRGKINQQRARRFMSCKNREEAMKNIKLEADEAKTIFDSNCITPGTVFMAKLNEELRYFVSLKISTDPTWRVPNIYLSGQDTPGEGEHKILEFIRYLKSQEEYDPATKHCFYGLDADLMMLSLATHEPYFSVLRKEVIFGGKQPKGFLTPDKIKFFLLHISIFRDYIACEFGSIIKDLPFEFDMERLIDDWILLHFLVGNDFIPNLPDFMIANNSLEVLYKSYKEVLPKCGGYIIDKGVLNLERFTIFIDHLSKIELELFEDKLADLRWLEGKMGSKCPDDLECLMETKEEPVSGFKFLDKDEVCRMVEQLEQLELVDDETEDELTILEAEFNRHKLQYYREKFELEEVDDDFIKELVHSYVQALQWICYYYHSGVPDWAWFYPFHYAPMASDVLRFCKDLHFDFNKNKPFLPFEQLLAVLPAGSVNLLPEAYRWLVTSPSSPIIEFYPKEFERDLNNHKHMWEAVVKIPFINEKLLLKAMEEGNAQLSKEEELRNIHGPMRLYSYSKESLGGYQCPYYFEDIANNHAKSVEIPRSDVELDRSAVRYGLCKGFDHKLHVEGIPRLNFLDFSVNVRKIMVRIFTRASDQASLVIIPKPIPLKDDDIFDYANRLIGKQVFVNWPFLQEGRAASISNGKVRIKKVDGRFITRALTSKEQSDREIAIKEMTEKKLTTRGIDYGDVKYTVNVVKILSRAYAYCRERAVMKLAWSEVEEECPLHVIVSGIDVLKDSAPEEVPLEELFTLNSVCFVTKNEYCGCYGEVISYDGNTEKSVTLRLSVPSEPKIDGNSIRKITKAEYYPGFVAAQRAGVSSYLFASLTGVLLVSSGSKNSSKNKSTNIGLNLKRNKTSMMIPGWTKKGNDGSWLYSQKAIDCAAEYATKFPELFAFLSNNPREHSYDVSSIFAGEEKSGSDDSDEACCEDEDCDGCKIDAPSSKLEKLLEWRKALPCFKVDPLPFDSELLDTEVVKGIEQVVDSAGEATVEVKEVSFKPEDLYLPGSLNIIRENKESSFRLFDRVAYTASTISPSVGQRGTIIGIIKRDNDEDSKVFEILFDKEFHGGCAERSNKPRVYQTSSDNLINITLEERLTRDKMQTMNNKKGIESSAIPEMASTKSRQSSVVKTDGIFQHYPNSPFAPTDKWNPKMNNMKPYPVTRHNNNMQPGLLPYDNMIRANAFQNSANYNSFRGDFWDPMNRFNWPAGYNNYSNRGHRYLGPSNVYSGSNQRFTPPANFRQPSNPEKLREGNSRAGNEQEFLDIWTCLKGNTKEECTARATNLPVTAYGNSYFYPQIKPACAQVHQASNHAHSQPTKIMSRPRVDNNSSSMNNKRHVKTIDREPQSSRINSGKSYTPQEFLKMFEQKPKDPISQPQATKTAQQQLIQLFSAEGGAPHYDFLKDNLDSHKIKAVVSVPGVGRYYGTEASNMTEAAESAAKEALKEVNDCQGQIKSNKQNYPTQAYYDSFNRPHPYTKQREGKSISNNFVPLQAVKSQKPRVNLQVNQVPSTSAQSVPSARPPQSYCTANHKNNVNIVKQKPKPRLAMNFSSDGK